MCDSGRCNANIVIHLLALAFEASTIVKAQPPVGVYIRLVDEDGFVTYNSGINYEYPENTVFCARDDWEFNIEAEDFTCMIEDVVQAEFKITFPSGETRVFTERKTPYWAFGDNDGEVNRGRRFEEGRYEVDVRFTCDDEENDGAGRWTTGFDVVDCSCTIPLRPSDL